MVFANPAYLWLLALIIPLIVWYIIRQHKEEDASIEIATTMPFDKLPKSYKYYLRHVRFGLRVIALISLIIAIARPQLKDSWLDKTTEGIDIVVALDISSSMLAKDFSPNRVEAAKDVATQFISGREYDNIGLVIFAEECFTMCPMTTDHSVLINLLSKVECGMLMDGTAIGEGLATAINRVKGGPAKSKTIILITDGTNNRGDITPISAADIASTFGVRVYTIGVGTNGEALTPVQGPYGIMYEPRPVNIDETTLRTIAQKTGGEYFRATDKNALKGIFEEINKLEKTKLSVSQYNKREEVFMPWVLLSMLLLCIDIILKNTILKNIP